MGKAILTAIVAVSCLWGGAVLAASGADSSDQSITQSDPALLNERSGAKAGVLSMPPSSGSMEDEDGNGLADGLEAKLKSLGPGEKINVIVHLTVPGPAANLQQSVGGFAVEHEFQSIDGFSASMTANQIWALSTHNDVFRIEEDVKARAFLNLARESFGVDDAENLVLNDPAMQAAGVTGAGAGVKVCIIDSGLDGDDPATPGVEEGNEMFSEVGSTRSILFTDIVGDINGLPQSAPYDDNFFGHGTHVAGIVGADGIANPLSPGSDPQIAPLTRGVAPEADLLIARVVRWDGLALISDIILGIDWCLLQGADVINMSLGAQPTNNCTDSLCSAAENAVASGVSVISAVGNSGDLPGTVTSPANGPNILAVGSIAEYSGDIAELGDPGLCDSAPHLGCRIDGGIHVEPTNSQGPGAQNAVKPNILAPGYNILSATNNEFVGPDLFGTPAPFERGCGSGCYTILRGSSQAAAFVAGAVALLLEADPSLTPAQVRSILEQTAVDRFMAGPDNISGHGMIDVHDAVAMAAGIVAVEDKPDFPQQMSGSLVVPAVDDNPNFIDLPFFVVDPTTPVGISMAIVGTADCVQVDIGSGTCIDHEWDPDIDMELYLGDPTAGGTLVARSECPLQGGCSLSADPVGQIETIGLFLEPADPTEMTLRFYAAASFWNGGAGGTIYYDISNASATPPPLVADAGPDRTIADSDGAPGEAVMMDGSGSSPAHLITDYRWDNLTTGSFLASGPSASITVPVPDGVNSIQLTVTHEDASTASDVAVITVESPGGGIAVVANAGADAIYDDSDGIAGETVTLDGSGSTPLATITSWQWSDLSDGGADLGSAMVVTPDLSDGVHTIRLTVSDGVDSDFDDMVVTVNAPAPPAAPSNIVAINNGDGTTSISWNDNSDNETGFELEREKKVKGQWVETTGMDVAGADQTSYLDAPGKGNFRYRARAYNAFGSSAYTAWGNVSVSGDYSAPVADAGPDQMIVEGDPLTLDGSASSGSSLSFLWSTASPGVMIDSPTSATTGVSGLGEGVHSFTLEVSDGTTSDSDNVTVTVLAAGSVMASAGPDQEVTEGETVTLDGSASSGPSLVYQWSTTAPGVVINNATSAVATVEGLVIGTYDFTLEVTGDNGSGSSDSDSLSVSVKKAKGGGNGGCHPVKGC